MPFRPVSSANAGSASGINAGGVGTQQGNAKNLTTQYKSSYIDPVMGPVSCAGVHKDGKNTGFTLGTDTWTCVRHDRSAAHGAVCRTGVRHRLELGSYYALIGQVPTTNAHITMSLDGMSETGTAAYGAAV